MYKQMFKCYIWAETDCDLQSKTFQRPQIKCLRAIASMPKVVVDASKHEVPLWAQLCLTEDLGLEGLASEFACSRVASGRLLGLVMTSQPKPGGSGWAACSERRLPRTGRASCSGASGPDWAWQTSSGHGVCIEAYGTSWIGRSGPSWLLMWGRGVQCFAEELLAACLCARANRLTAPYCGAFGPSRG